MFPFSMNNMLSASRMVDSLCAMTKDVLPFMGDFMASPISASARVPTLEVASSRMRIGGVAKKHPRYREKLPLPNGYVGRVVVERGVIALRQSLDEIVDPRHFGGLLDFLARGVFLPIGDVFRDRAGEEPRVLQHHPEVAPQICPRELCCWDAVNPDVPAVDLVKAHEEVDERRFPILILTILKKPIREFLK